MKVTITTEFRELFNLSVLYYFNYFVENNILDPEDEPWQSANGERTNDWNECEAGMSDPMNNFVVFLDAKRYALLRDRVRKLLTFYVENILKEEI